MLNKQLYINQINSILTNCQTFKSRATHPDLSGIAIEDIIENLTRVRTTIVRITGENSHYYKDFEAIEKRPVYYGQKLVLSIGVLSALKSDLENDYLQSLSNLIHADVFSNYIEMAEHLLKEGYKDPAAVLIGSTLEAHIRELCNRNEIETILTNNKNEIIPKKADTMNSDLVKSNIYSSIQQKQITAWLGIRNSAAHGKYEEYSMEQVSLMLQGILNFISSTN